MGRFSIRKTKARPKPKKISGKEAKKDAIKGFNDIYGAATMSEDIFRASQNDDLRDSIDNTISALLSFGTDPAVLENCIESFVLPSYVMEPKSMHKNNATRTMKISDLCYILADAAEDKRKNRKNIISDQHIQNIREAFIDIAKTFPPAEKLKKEYEKSFFERMGDKFRLKKTDKSDNDSAMINIMSRLDEKSK